MEKYPSVSEGVPVFKISVVGDSGVGKTNIISRYLNDSFIEEENQTIAVQFVPKHVETRTLNYWLHIWDTGGQPRFEAITTVYYRGSKAILIVFDVSDRSTFLSVSKWYDKVKIYTDKEKVIIFVIGNKTDKEEREVEISEVNKMIERFENCKYFECSAKKGSGIETLFLALGVILNETAVRDKFRLNIGSYEHSMKSKKRMSVSDYDDIGYPLIHKERKSGECGDCSKCCIL